MGRWGKLAIEDRKGPVLSERAKTALRRLNRGPNPDLIDKYNMLPDTTWDAVISAPDDKHAQRLITNALKTLKKSIAASEKARRDGAEADPEPAPVTTYPLVLIVQYDNPFQTGDTMSVCLLSMYHSELNKHIDDETQRLPAVALYPKSDGIMITGKYYTDWLTYCGVLHGKGSYLAPRLVKTLKTLRISPAALTKRSKYIMHITEMQGFTHQRQIRSTNTLQSITGVCLRRMLMDQNTPTLIRKYLNLEYTPMHELAVVLYPGKTRRPEHGLGNRCLLLLEKLLAGYVGVS